MEDSLNQQFDIKTYSNTVQSIFCFFIIRWADPTLKTTKRFFKKDGILRWRLVLNHEKVIQANLEETTFIMATAYLEAIESYFKNFKHDFDGERFYKDVKTLFEQKGWITVETLQCKV